MPAPVMATQPVGICFCSFIISLASSYII